MNDVTLRQLQVFTKIVEEGSFNLCARSLDISGVAITGHIKKLEQRLGHKLFQRHPGEIAVLTEEGESDYQIVSGILAGFNKLLKDPYKNTKQRKLRIALDPFIFHCMQKGMKNLESLHPGIDLQYQFEETSYSDIDKKITENSVDIGFFFALSDYYSQNSKFIAHTPLAIYVGNKHPLAKKEVVSVSELVKFSAIETSKSNPLNSLFNRALEQIGLSGFDVAMQTDNMALFERSLASEPYFSCMIKMVEDIYADTNLKMNAKRLILDCPMPTLQIRQIIRSPLQHDSLVSHIAEQLSTALHS